MSTTSYVLSKNKKTNVYPYKSQFYYIKVGFKGVKIIELYKYVFVIKYQHFPKIKNNNNNHPPPPPKKKKKKKKKKKLKKKTTKKKQKKKKKKKQQQRNSIRNKALSGKGQRQIFGWTRHDLYEYPTVDVTF